MVSSEMVVEKKCSELLAKVDWWRRAHTGKGGLLKFDLKLDLETDFVRHFFTFGTGLWSTFLSHMS